MLPHGCTHYQMTSKNWVYRRAAQQELAELYRNPITKIFHFFTVDNPNVAVKSTGGAMQSLWKVRSADLLDNTFDLNEILQLLESLGLFDSKLTPKAVTQMYTSVTFQDEVVAQVHKNNNDRCAKLAFYVPRDSKSTLDALHELVCRFEVTGDAQRDDLRRVPGVRFPGGAAAD